MVMCAVFTRQAVDNLLEESEQLEKPKISKIKSRVKVADKENVPQSARTHKAEARELRPRPCHVEALCPRRPAPNSAKQKLCGHEKDGFVEKQEITDEERSSVEELEREPHPCVSLFAARFVDVARRRTL